MTQPPARADIPERTELAQELLRLREASGLSTTVLAAKLGDGWSQSRVSRIERGKNLPKPADVEAWARATNATADLAHLVELARKAGLQMTEWKRELAPGRRAKQEEIARLQKDSSVIRIFGAEVIPGLAQNRAYARMMFQLGRLDVTDEPDDLEAVLDARMAGQAVLDDKTKRIELLMSETALHRRLLDDEDQSEQIDRLIEISHLENVRLGVIPFDPGANLQDAADRERERARLRERVHQYHGYAVLGDPAHDDSALVLAETLTRGLTIRAPEEVQAYIDHFEQLDAAALHGGALRDLLRQEEAGRAT